LTDKDVVNVKADTAEKNPYAIHRPAADFISDIGSMHPGSCLKGKEILDTYDHDS
jgi:hypothetical protein